MTMMALKTSQAWTQRKRGVAMLLQEVEYPQMKHRIGRRSLSAMDLAEEVQRGSMIGEIMRKLLR